MLRNLLAVELRVIVVIALVICWRAVEARSQEPVPKESKIKAPPNAADAPKFDAQSAVQNLACKNSAPRIESPIAKPVLPSNYDWAEQANKWKLIGTLLDHIEEAWPELVSHLDDKRYCMTVTNHLFGYNYNWTVGDVCQILLARNLSQPYWEALKPGSLEVYRKLRRPGFAAPKDRLKEWCAQYRSEKLFQLQIKACEWAREELSKEGDDWMTPEVTRMEWRDSIQVVMERLTDSQSAIRFTKFPRTEYLPYSQDAEGDDPFDKK